MKSPHPKLSDHQVGQPKYRNITISGLPGAGSTTLLNHLKTGLQFEGWKGFSGGEFMRAYAIENGLFQEEAGLHHSSLAYNDDFDRRVDMGIREKLSVEKQWIIESWLSGFLAQGVPGVLKVLMVCSSKAVRVDRVVNRDNVSPEEAIANMQKRYDENLNKWRRMYQAEWQQWVVEPGTLSAKMAIDFWRPELYDLVVDTYSVSQQEAADQVIDAIHASSET